ncbi:MAG: type III toxin-antitoxin system ToxN/AbiQ family toxin [Clostridia bacterium]|nr:type III toxin-antitoxin system ToxN/AbiQ family toxin [Clostridia bacterium]
MKNFKLYYIADEYIDYLRQFDTKVAYNKSKSRPYVGVVYSHEGSNYFVPLHSPKEKHKKINDKSVDIYKIKNGELGVININNMIPAPMRMLSEVLPIIEDRKYKTLLEKQLSFLNNNKRALYEKISWFIFLYQKGRLNQRILNRCCDFKLLEKKCIEYDKIY